MSKQKDSVVVPTIEMLEAGAYHLQAAIQQNGGEPSECAYDHCEAIYKAMLSASASHPQEKDAERYRWLRDESEHYDCGPGVRSAWPVYGFNGTDCHPIFGDELDAAIDRAIKETGER